ncbi:30S ribosomal protein S6 [Candidatus Palauibacter soopunensis]|uniref:30S ribosomal protein S6 n=1 Tax=Candidatus Palauibacter soopunensis TaxID=3056739 RepID=UPI0023856FBD|nr:30S ribosomal protein S6 [Candidatus Palauibacter soopunensis]MDE2878811.1 30S ribosomal protein S6 [Candidatus Palauibacter soopunensis]
MRDYEIVYIFRSSLTSEEIEAKLERYHAIISADGPGEVTASVHWGKRQLAYPIQKQPNGYYVVAQFASEPDPLRELERVLKLEDDVLRYLIVIAEQPLPLPDPVPETPATEEPAAEEAEAEAAEPDAGAASETEEAEETDDEAPSEAEAEVEAPADETEETDAAEETDGAEEAADEADGEDEAEEAAEEAADEAEADADGDAGEPEESADAEDAADEKEE